MSLFNKIQEVKSQIVDTERMLHLVGDHPIMGIGFKERLEELRSELEAYPKDIIEPKIRLLFSGGAVVGSQGIKANFISKTVKPFQSLVKTQAALIRYGNPNKRGKKRKKGTTDLYLTALPIGSFGVELSQLETNDLFDEQEVAKAIKQTMKLIQSAAESDEKFESATENAPYKTIKDLKTFLKEVYNENSIIKMESGGEGIKIPEERVKIAFERVEAAEIEEEETFVHGILRGILLDSGKFEIVDDAGKPISGLISGNLDEEEVISFNQEFLNRSCRIHLKIHRKKYKTGNINISYELLGIGKE